MNNKSKNINISIIGSAVIESSIGRYIINEGRMSIVAVEIGNIFHNFRPEFEG
jgi:hypothetical protein